MCLPMAFARRRVSPAASESRSREETSQGRLDETTITIDKAQTKGKRQYEGGTREYDERARESAMGKCTRK